MSESAVRAAIDRLLSEHDPASDSPQDFWEAQYDAGLAWVYFDAGFG
ncbi:MAG: acyl-CoA dehydrogenase, partial [bacterium]|nr:acyl-CoA dehydrogenase [bacterium]